MSQVKIICRIHKSKSKNNKKIRKSTKNVRNPHILRTLQFLHFFELFKNFRDFIWLEYFLNRFITHRRWSNDLWKKNQIQKCQKIRKGTKNVRISHILHTHPFLHLFELYNNFEDLIWLGYCLNRFIKLRRRLNDLQKNPNKKILKN